MNISKLAFDVDGIVLDTATEMWKTITKHLNLARPIDDWVDYDIGKIVGVPIKELRPIYEPVLQRDDLPPVRGADRVLNSIALKYDVPLLFITARRAQFKDAAIASIERILEKGVDYQVICTGDIHEDESRNDKLDLLLQHKVELFVEDNYLHWEKYIDHGIDVATLAWPWTTEKAMQLLTSTGKRVMVYPNWNSLHEVLDYCLEE
jgi:uncharacterized HAD superfamily protein